MLFAGGCPSFLGRIFLSTNRTHEREDEMNSPGLRSAQNDHRDFSSQPDWTLFYAQHRPRITRLCRLWVKDRMDAEDLTQEILVKVIRNWERFRGEAKPETWLYVIARNACWTFLSRRQLNQSKMLILEARVASESRRNTENLLAAGIDFKRILERSSPRTRSILLLRFREGWSFAEIAQEFGVTHVAVHNRISRALAQGKP